MGQIDLNREGPLEQKVNECKMLRRGKLLVRAFFNVRELLVCAKKC